MNKPPRLISSAFSCLALLGASSARADLKITTSVTVTNAPSTPGVAPLPGLYLTEYHKNQARTYFPNGTYRIFDFDKKQVWTVDPSQKTFYQLSLDNFLKLGSNIPTALNPKRYEVSLGSTFKAADGQASKQVSGYTVLPYDAVALGMVEPKSASASRSGGGGGHRRGGGGVFGGGGGGSSTPTPDPGTGLTPISANDYTVKSFGQFWMAKPNVTEVNSVSLMIPQVSLVLPYAPGLKNLVDDVRKSNLLPVEGDFTIQHGLVTISNPAPVVVSTVTGIEAATTSPDDFLIPTGFLKVDAPGTFWPS